MHSDPSIPLLQAGESFDARRRYTREQIIEFARLSGDANPLHHDQQLAQRTQFGEIIASGQQTASQMMGLVASGLSAHEDGRPREMLCLNFNFAFKAPVFAEQDIDLQWTVTAVEHSAAHNGLIGHLDGHARVAGKVCVVGRGTVLVRKPQAVAR